jgi:hypothetical protein
MLSQTYGQAFPPQSVLISGNTHAPSPNGSAVLAICGDGIILEANEFGSRTRSAASTNVALVETCSDSSLCGVYNLFMKANTGFTAVAPADSSGHRSLLNRGQVRPRPTISITMIESLCIELPRHGDSIIACDGTVARCGCVPRPSR